MINFGQGSKYDLNVQKALEVYNQRNKQSNTIRYLDNLKEFANTYNYLFKNRIPFYEREAQEQRLL